MSAPTPLQAPILRGGPAGAAPAAARPQAPLAPTLSGLGREPWGFMLALIDPPDRKRLRLMSKACKALVDEHVTAASAGWEQRPAALVAAAPLRWPALRTLRLDFSEAAHHLLWLQRSSTCAAAFAVTAPRLREMLRTLVVVSVKLGKSGMEGLANSSWPFLEELYLVHSELSSEGAASLAASPPTQTLRTLHLDGNRLVGDAGVRALAGGSWPQLQALGTAAPFRTRARPPSPALACARRCRSCTWGEIRTWAARG